LISRAGWKEGGKIGWRWCNNRHMCCREVGAGNLATTHGDWFKTLLLLLQRRIEKFLLDTR
jgi:hypothetical protein